MTTPPKPDPFPGPQTPDPGRLPKPGPSAPGRVYSRFEVELKATLDLMGAILPEPDQIALANISPELVKAYTQLAEREGAKTIKQLVKRLADKRLL